MRDANPMRDANDRLLATELSRRRFLGVAAGAGLVLTGCSGKGGKATAPTVTSRPHLPAASFSGPPFTLGVASGATPLRARSLRA